MSPLTGKQTITPNTADDTSVKPIEKEILQSTSLAKGIHFFGDKIAFYIANRLEFRQKAYEYIYRIYCRKGYANTKTDGLWLSLYDALPDTTTFFAENDNGKLRGALTVVPDSPIGLPADSIYKKEIDSLRNSKREICELISLGLIDNGKDSVKILTGIFYCAYLLAWRIKKNTDIVITVNPKHQEFYRRRLLFKKIGSERKHPKVNGAPAVLLSLPLEILESLTEEQKKSSLYKLKLSESEEIRKTKRMKEMIRPISDEEFYTFFIEKTDVWESATSGQKKIFRKIFDANAIDHFSISRALAKGISKTLHNTDSAPLIYNTKAING